MARLVPNMIAGWAAVTPDEVAAVDGSRTVTYQRLLDDAWRVAAAVRAAGVGRDEVVGLSCPCGLPGLTGMLGVLLAGAAYLYLDPAWPAWRREHMARECRMRLALTDPAAAPVPLPPGVAGLPVDVAAGHRDGTRRADGTGPGDLCYVAYTSGSTDVPRGVAVEHGGAANMARQLAVVLGLAPGVRMLQAATWAWDGATAEILVTLCAGGTLVLAADAVRHGGDELAALLYDQRVQVATLTPSLLAALPQVRLPYLRALAAVGEPCPPEVVARWAPGRRFLNGYGPTEATVAVSVGRCRPGQPVTIGRPLRGVQVLVVNPDGTPVAGGCPGELIVGGRGVARGYVTATCTGQGPLITSAGRFLDLAGTRWYRTGDLVSRRPDGSMFYQGRTAALATP